MATLPKPELAPRYLDAEELLALRGTPEFDRELSRQRAALAASQRAKGYIDGAEFFDWNVPGWKYDAEL